MIINEVNFDTSVVKTHPASLKDGSNSFSHTASWKIIIKVSRDSFAGIDVSRGPDKPLKADITISRLSQ